MPATACHAEDASGCAATRPAGHKNPRREDSPPAIRPGLAPHGLRHSHRTSIAEDGIPETLAEPHPGHEVPGIRGLHVHMPDRTRDDLKAALQARWKDSPRAQAGIHATHPSS